jgi:phytoene/squalene synthetase
MSVETSLAACEETVRRVDPDRYLSALFAPAERRPMLFALYAFNHELARIAETVKEPMAAAIRLEWWREALEGAHDGRPRAHDVARGLAEMFAQAGPPIELFAPLFAAREFDSGTESFAHLADLEAYGDATAGTVMRVAARLLDEQMQDDALFRHAGAAFALTGILRAMPFLGARAMRYMPTSLSSGNITSAQAVEKIVACARAHHAAVRAMTISGRILPSVLPASLVPLYARNLLRAGADALTTPIEIPLYRRQWAMFWAATRGQV